MAQKGNLLTHVVILGVGAALSKFTVFLLMPLYTASLSPAAFGTAEILINTAVLLLPLVSLNAPEAVFRFLAGGVDAAGVLRVGRRLLWAGLVVFLCLLPLLALYSVLRPFLFYLFFYVAASVWHSFYAHILRARGEYALYAVQQLFCTFLTVALSFLFLPVLDLGAAGYLLAILLSDAVTAVILGLYLHSTRPVGGESGDKLLGPMLSYALPLIPGGTLWWIISFFDRFILLSYHSEVLTGLYAAAGKLPSLVTFAAGIFLEAWHFAAIHAGEKERGRLFGRMYDALLPALVFFALMLILFSEFLVKRIFAPAFWGAAAYVPMLVLGYFFSALSSFLGSVYVVNMRSLSSLSTAVFGAAVNLACSFLWIPARGVAGAVAATLVSYVAVFVWRAVYVHTVIPFCQHTVKLICSVAVLFAVAQLVTRGHFTTALVLSPFSLLPFVREIYAGAGDLWGYLHGILTHRQKATEKLDNTPHKAYNELDR